MKPLEVRKYLWDVVQACGLIESFTRGCTFEEYADDAMVRSAVERQFEIIGEALAAALRVDSSLETEISGIARIIAFRNRLIHGYASVSAAVVWGVVETHLTILREEAAALLGEPG